VSNVVSEYKQGRKLFRVHRCENCGGEFERPSSRPALACSDACKVALILARSPRGRPVVVHEIKCVICGTVTPLTGTERNHRQLKTCGAAACTSALLSRQAAGKLRLEDRPEAWEAARLEGHHASPRSGPWESNAQAKEWHLCAPSGAQHHFRNLSLFLREHSGLFDPEDLEPRPYGCRAISGLGRLRPERRDRRDSWKGWTWI